MTEPDGSRKRRKPEYAPAFAWDRPAVLRAALAAAAGIFAIGVTSWSWSCFAAAVLHNEGLKKADEHAVLSRIESRKGQALDAAREAKELYRRSLELDPTRGTTYYKLAHIQNTLGEQEEALKTYRKLQEYQPDYSEIHYNLGVMQFSIANAKRKQAEAERTAGKGDAAAALLGEAEVLYKGSLASMERATRLSSKIVIAYMQARIMAQYAETLPDGSPERAAMHAKAGATYERASQLPVSTVIVEDGQEDREEELRFSALLLSREAYVAAGDKAGAIRMTEKYLAEVPTSLKSLQQAIDLYSEIGEASRAIALLDGWLDRNPLNPDVLNMKLKVQRATGDTRAAAETAKYLLVLDDDLKQRNIQFLPDRDVQRIRKALSDLEAQGPAPP